MTVSVCLMLLACAATAADWPQWRGVNRDGKSTDAGLLKEWPKEGPKQLWKAADVGIGYASPTIVGETIYIAGDVGDEQFLFALDKDGKQKWKVSHGPGWKGKRSPGAMGSVVHHDGMLYLLSGNGLLKAYDAKDGAVKWKADMAKDFGGKVPGWGYSESPMIYKDNVIVTPGGNNCIVALDRKTGKKVWASTGLKDEANYSSAIAVEFEKHPIIIQAVAGGLVGIDANDGKFLWRCKRAVNTACATPVYSDGYAFMATGYGNGGACVKLSVKDGKVDATQVWETKEMECHHGGYVVHEGHIYGNHLQGWSCLELATGKKKWFAKGVGKGSICFADGMLYTLGENGTMGLVKASPDGFESKGEFRVSGKGPSWAYPVVVNGRLFIRYDTNLYCYDVRGKEYKE